MSIAQFQKALYQMIADIPTCIAVRSGNKKFLSNFELTNKERRRLLSVSMQPGMNTNCTLFRMNRVTPLYTSMPNICKMLQKKLLDILLEFWEKHPKSTLQYKEEIKLFYFFLKNKIEDNSISIQYLDKILEFEGKINELRFDDSYTTEPRGKYILSKHLRLIKWNCDPSILLENIAEENYKFPNLPEETHYLLVENSSENLELKMINNSLGTILENLEKFDNIPTELMEMGFVERNQNEMIHMGI